MGPSAHPERLVGHPHPSFRRVVIGPARSICAMNAISVSNDCKCMAWPDTTCSTRPTTSPHSTTAVASHWMTKARGTDNRIGWSLGDGIRPSWQRLLALLTTDNKRSVYHPRNLENGLKPF